MPTTYENYEKYVDQLAASVAKFGDAFKNSIDDPKIPREIWAKAWPEIKRVYEINPRPFNGMRNSPESLAYASVRACHREDWEDYAVTENERIEIIDNIREANDIIIWLSGFMGGEE